MATLSIWSVLIKNDDFNAISTCDGKNFTMRKYQVQNLRSHISLTSRHATQEERSDDCKSIGKTNQGGEQVLMN